MIGLVVAFMAGIAVALFIGWYALPRKKRIAEVVAEHLPLYDTYPDRGGFIHCKACSKRPGDGWPDVEGWAHHIEAHC